MPYIGGKRGHTEDIHNLERMTLSFLSSSKKLLLDTEGALNMIRQAMQEVSYKTQQNLHRSSDPLQRNAAVPTDRLKDG